MINNADSTARWVVAHSGARDNYQLPIALHEAGQLHRFVTDFYSPLDEPVIDAVLKSAPQGVRSALSRRYRNALPSRVVKDMKVRGALKRVLGPVGWKGNVLMDGLIGRRAAQVASSSGSHLLITSYYGWAAFPRLAKETKKVLFQLHPHPWFLRDLYMKCENGIGAASRFQSEAEMQVDEEFLQRWGQESLDADLLIASSSFTRKSLIYAGVQPDKIVVVTLGVDGSNFRDDISAPSGKPRILFVGQATSRKGFQDLLRVWKNVGDKGAELYIVSGTETQQQGLGSSDHIVWCGRLPHSDLVALMNSVDLLVLPSVAEGFGLVLLQSLSCGTPILCSDATAGPDLLSEWEDGFIFPAGDWDGFASRLDYWIANVGRLRALRRLARTTAESRTWESFREGVRNVCSKALSSGVEK
jgi:glycosyltransferase involved in cell wall biosynthesis